MLHNSVLFLWRQEDTSSFRLLSVDNSGWQRMRVLFFKAKAASFV